jgi:hypothetical protein
MVKMETKATILNLNVCGQRPSQMEVRMALVLDTFQQGSHARLWFVPLLIAPVWSQALLSPQSGTAAAVSFITFVQDLKRKSKAWAPMIELCASGEKTLERFRYQFPDDWLYSDQLRGEWSAYNEILKRKSDSIQEQLGIVVPVAS